MTRRKFISSVAIAGVPPWPPGARVLRSPKDAEHVQSLKKVAAPKAIAIQAMPRPIAAALPNISVLSIAAANGIATLSWEHGTPPFEIEQQVEIGGPWVVAVSSTLARSAQVPINQEVAFFRVREAVPMPITVEVQSDGIHLAWEPPDL